MDETRLMSLQVFSDILTPLPAMGISFDVVRGRGPIVLGDLARTLEDGR